MTKFDLSWTLSILCWTTIFTTCVNLCQSVINVVYILFPSICRRREYVTFWLLDHAWFSHLLATHWLCIVIILIVVQMSVSQVLGNNRFWRQTTTANTLALISDIRINMKHAWSQNLACTFLSITEYWVANISIADNWLRNSVKWHLWFNTTKWTSWTEIQNWIFSNSWMAVLSAQFWCKKFWNRILY